MRRLAYAAAALAMSAALIGLSVAEGVATSIELMGYAWDHTPTVAIRLEGGVDARYRDMAIDALNTWRNALNERAGSDIFRYVLRDAQGAEITIYMAFDELPNDVEAGHAPTGLASTTFRGEVITTVFITVDILSPFSGLPLDDADVWATIAHELGHAWGLGHSNDDERPPFDLMAPSTPVGASIELSDVDLNGILQIYRGFGFSRPPSVVNLGPSYISVFPTSLVAGSRVEIKGEGFIWQEPVTIKFDELEIANVTLATGSSELFMPFTLPASHAGVHKITAVQPRSGFSATQFVHVILGFMPLEQVPGKDVTVSGFNFLEKFDTAIIKLGGRTMGMEGTDDTGSFKTAFTVPEMASGVKEVTVSTGKRIMNSRITVKKGISSVEPADGIPGTLITVKGGGYPPNRQLEVRFGDADESFTVATVTTNERGSFIATLTLPELSEGTKTIDTYPIAADEGFKGNFRVIPAVPVAPPVKPPTAGVEVLLIPAVIAFAIGLIVYLLVKGRGKPAPPPTAPSIAPQKEATALLEAGVGFEPT